MLRPNALQRARRANAPLRWLALLLALVALAAACGSDDGPSAGDPGSGSNGGGGQSSGDTFKVGAVYPMSGNFGEVGAGLRTGLEIGVEEVNAQGGILGRQVELIVKDSAGDPTRGLAAARELVESDQVDLLIPDAFPNVVLAILEYTTENEIVTVTQSGSPVLTDAETYPYSFAVGLAFELWVPVMAERFDQLGATKVGAFVSDDPGGSDTMAIWEEQFPEQGLDLVAIERYDPSAIDVTPQLQSLAANDIDSIALFASGAQTGVVMKGVRDLGLDLPVVANGSALAGELQNLIPTEVADQFSAAASRIQSREQDDAIDERYVPFTDAVKAKGPVTSITGSASGVDLMHLMRWLFDTAGSTDTEAVVAVAEGMVDDRPDLDFLYVPTPRWSATVHGTQTAELGSDLSAIVQASRPLDGTYLVASDS